MIPALNSGLGLIAALLIFPGSATAHGIGVEAKVRGRTVEVEVFFEDGSPAAGAEVRIVGEGGRVAAHSRTDTHGLATFASPAEGRYRVEADSGDGHQATTSLVVPGGPAESVPGATGAGNRRTGLYLGLGAGLLGLVLLGLRQVLRSTPGKALQHSRGGFVIREMLAAATAVAIPVCLFVAVTRDAEPSRSPVWNEAAARHLLSRTSFGSTPEQARAMAAVPLETAVDRLLDDAAGAAPMPRPDWVRDVWVNGLRRYSDMPREEYLVTFRRTSTRNDDELLDLKARWLRQMVRSPAPLRENLTLFWHGYFTSASSKMFAVSQAFYQQNATWRKHALGNFREFLEAVTLDPGMLIYLDMEESDRDNPNENYARELLELFSLGVGNYTEGDIREISRALTGWTLDVPPGTVKPDRTTSPETARSLRRDGLVPTFIPAKHDAGTKTVFGKTGNYGVREVLDMIVSHPACGRHVAGRLIEYFGVSDPAGTLRARLADEFVRGRSEIRPLLKALFCSAEFYSKESIGNRVKSPVRLLVGACRDLDLQGELTPALAQATVPLGQELFNPPTVKGWHSGDEWITATTLTLRYRLAEVLLDGKPLTGIPPIGRIRGTLIPRNPTEGAATIARLLALDAEKANATDKAGLAHRFEPGRLAPETLADNPDALVASILERTLVVPPRAATREAIVRARREVPAQDRIRLAVRLVLASPEYQVE